MRKLILPSNHSLLGVLLAGLVLSCAGGCGKRSTALAPRPPRPSSPITARSTNAEICDAILYETDRVAHPGRQGMYLALTAEALQQWDKARAAAVAREAADKLLLAEPAPRVEAPKDVDGEGLERWVGALVKAIERTTALRALIAVDPRQAVSLAEEALQDPAAVEAFRLEVALQTREGTWALPVLASTQDPARKAFAALAVALARVPRKKPAAEDRWGYLSPVLPYVAQVKDPALRAELLTSLGAAARRLGRKQEWEQRLQPELFSALAATKDSAAARAYGQCLKTARKLDPTLVPMLLAEAKREAARRKLPAEAKQGFLIQVLAPVRPAEALHLLEGVRDPQVRAAELMVLIWKSPVQDQSLLQQEAATARALLRAEGVRPSSRHSLLGIVAKVRPEEALALVPREAQTPKEQANLRSRLLQGAAEAQPDWVLSHLSLAPDRESRLSLMVTALRARVGVTPATPEPSGS